MKETPLLPDKQLEILEALKPKLGKFITEKLLNWGLTTQDLRLVDEAGFGFAGIPIYGPELSRMESGWSAHIDISINQSAYTGPKSDQEHPTKIILPGNEAHQIAETYGIDVSDFIKGSDKFFSLPTIEVKLANTVVLIPEPVSHVKVFAEETILYYSLKQAGESKLQEWFEKLKTLKDISQNIHQPEVTQIASEMIQLSIDRWQEQGWSWLF